MVSSPFFAEHVLIPRLEEFLGRNPKLPSPAYLRRSGRPKVPADLSSHDIIAGPMAAP